MTCIELQAMPQLVDAVGSDDDWTGLTDAKMRRKRQNRLNVRAYRKRKAQACQIQVSNALGGKALTKSSTSSPHNVHLWSEYHQSIITLPIQNVARTHCPNHSTPLLPMDTPAAVSTATLILPLSSDHLIMLLQYNSLRGNLANRKFLDHIPGMDSSLHSNFAPTDLHVFPALSNHLLQQLPPAFHPTLLQQSTLYPHWVDLVPHPLIRDKIIHALADGTLNPLDFWRDIVGGLFEGFSDDEVLHKGVVMWNDPWTWEGWELSQTFVHKWGWLLTGCGDVLKGTNAWRATRGERGIVFEIE